jgi:GT2 family glycosyltransferase
MNAPLVEVIILTLNGKGDTVKCLQSLARCSYPNFRVTVVDQNSSDGTPAVIEKEFPWVNLIRNPRNTGFCEGNNIVLKQSEAAYCVLLNNDTEQDPDWLTTLVNVAEQDPEIATLQPKVLSMREPHKFEYAGAAGGFMDIYGYPLCQGRVFDRLEEDNGQYDVQRDIFWSCGVAMFLRMEVLKRVGYLDELMFIYAEELDLCWRLNLAGYKLRYVPESVIYHLGSATMTRRQFRYRKEYLTHRNHWIILVKNYEVRTWWRIFPVKLLLEVLAAVRFLPTQPRKSVAIVHAALWVLWHPLLLWRKNRELTRFRRIRDWQMFRRMIRTSIALQYFILGKRRFPEYVRYIEEFEQLPAPGATTTRSTP